MVFNAVISACSRGLQWQKALTLLQRLDEQCNPRNLKPIGVTHTYISLLIRLSAPTHINNMNRYIYINRYLKKTLYIYYDKI